MALADGQGIPVAQIGYTPYGQPIFFDIQQTGAAITAVARANPVGHQGLFYDRFDQGVVENGAAVLAADDPGQVPFLGYYRNRNRTCVPWRSLF